MAEDKGKPRFIRKNGKVIPIRGDKKKSGDNKTIKTGDYKGVKRGRKKQITKEVNAEKGHFKKRNKVIGKSQKFGIEAGVSLGIGAAVMRKGSLLKGAGVGALIGLVGGTLVGKSRADKKVGTIRDFHNKKKKDSTGF